MTCDNIGRAFMDRARQTAVGDLTDARSLTPTNRGRYKEIARSKLKPIAFWRLGPVGCGTVAHGANHSAIARGALTRPDVSRSGDSGDNRPRRRQHRPAE